MKTANRQMKLNLTMALWDIKGKDTGITEKGLEQAAIDAIETGDIEIINSHYTVYNDMACIRFNIKGHEFIISLTDVNQDMTEVYEEMLSQDGEEIDMDAEKSSERYEQWLLDTAQELLAIQATEGEIEPRLY